MKKEEVKIPRDEYNEIMRLATIEYEKVVEPARKEFELAVNKGAHAWRAIVLPWLRGYTNNRRPK